MKLEELFTTYWSQVTLLLLAVGYLIKRLLDTRSKKIEINHTLFQQNRLSAVNRFFENYSKAVTIWNQLRIYEIVRKQIVPEEMNKFAIPTLNELDKNTYELRIYFDKIVYQKFESLVSNLKTINEKVLNLWFDDSFISIENKVKSYNEFKDEAYRENHKILDDLTKALKAIFKT